MIEYIIFGVIDNAVMLSGALFGVSIEKKFPEKLQSGFLGGLGAANLSLAFGSAIGCLIALILIPIYSTFKMKGEKR